MEQFVPLGLAALAEAIAQEHEQNLRVVRSSRVPNPILYYPQTEEYQRQQHDTIRR
jgi:hypothetical protein